MVVFTCNHCGDSVKKNQVETHAMRCYRQVSVSCMDCNKDFDGKTYNAHTQCVTEQEKYSPKGFVAKPASTKGREKQQAWLSMVNSVIASSRNLPAEDKKLLTIISNYSNIPRKKIKFQNFLKNGIFFGSQKCVDRVWDMLQQKFAESKNSDKADVGTTNDNKEEKIQESENVPQEIKVPEGDEEETKLTKKQKKALKKAKSEAISAEVNTEQDETDVTAEEIGSPHLSKKKKGKKRKSAVEENGNDGPEIHNGDTAHSPNKKSKVDDVVDLGNTLTKGSTKTKKKKANASVNNESPSPNKEGDLKFDWQDAIVKTLESTNDKKLPVKQLRKKVLARYASETGRPITETLKAKFSKRLNGVSVVKAVKGIAVLSSTT